MAEEYVIVDKADLEIIANSAREKTSTTDKYSVAALAEAMASTIVPPLPADSPGNKQLVTDSTGKTKWIDQYCCEEKGFITLLEEQTIDFSSDFDIGFPLYSYDNYTIYVDGTEYNLTRYYEEIIPGEIGFHAVAAEDGTFYIHERYMHFEDGGSHTVKIGAMGTAIKTLDDKFLSNNIARSNEVIKSINGFYPDSNGNISVNQNVSWNSLIDKPLIKKGEGNSAVVIGYTDANIASGVWSLAEGSNTVASGKCAHAEGEYTTASGDRSHVEGWNNEASHICSHAEGECNTTSGRSAHAEGAYNTASGSVSHAEGADTTASGASSHAEGYGTIAASGQQHVQGKFNIEDADNKYAHIVGNGIGFEADRRSNAHTLDWSGNAWYAGTVEGTAMIVKSSTANSTKRFKITVDDSGTISATEITT